MTASLATCFCAGGGVVLRGDAGIAVSSTRHRFARKTARLICLVVVDRRNQINVDGAATSCNISQCVTDEGTDATAIQ